MLGGRGFVGRHAVAALETTGATVIIGTRYAGAANDRELRLEQLLDPVDWADAIEDVDVVLNCVGILRQRGAATYDRIHHRSPEALAAACAALGKRLVHVSALGLHDGARSRFLTSKLAGERRVRASGADWIIVRPSLLDGEGGFGARWLRGVAKLPVFLAPADARGRIAALHVEDLGAALARLCTASPAALRLDAGREFELGGDEHFVFADYIRRLRERYSRRRAPGLPVPGLLARGFAHLCDLLHFTPFSFGHWELLRRDNLPQPNRLAELLGREPRRIE